MDTVGKTFRAIAAHLPAWPYLLAAAVLWLIARWLGSTEILKPLSETTQALMVDLQVLSPLNVLGAYYYHLTGCGADYIDGSVVANCNASGDVWQKMQNYGLGGGIGILAWPAVMLYETAVTLWDNSGWMGRIIYLLTLPAGIYGASEAVIAMSDNTRTATGKIIPEDWTPFGWALFVALIPAFAGLTAMLLQWLLIVIIWIFGLALAGIVWLLAILATPIAYAHAMMGVVKDATELEKGTSILTGKVKDPHEG